MASNLGQYGLNDPQIVVTLKKGDQEWKLNVGEQTTGQEPAWSTSPPGPSRSSRWRCRARPSAPSSKTRSTTSATRAC